MWIFIVCEKQSEKGEITREIKERYKIIYLGKTNTRNYIGVILDTGMKRSSRKNDKVIMVRVILDNKLLNIVIYI